MRTMLCQWSSYFAFSQHYQHNNKCRHQATPKNQNNAHINLDLLALSLAAHLAHSSKHSCGILELCNFPYEPHRRRQRICAHTLDTPKFHVS